MTTSGNLNITTGTHVPAASPQQPCRTCGTCPTCGTRPAPYTTYPQWWYPNTVAPQVTWDKLVVTTGDHTYPINDITVASGAQIVNSSASVSTAPSSFADNLKTT